LKKKRGKINAQRSIEKMCAPIKEHRKKYMKHDPPLKARGESQRKE
jgi:hypothetical protein